MKSVSVRRRRRRRHFLTWHFEQGLFSRLLKERREEKKPSVIFIKSAPHLFSGNLVVLGKTSGAIKSRSPFVLSVIPEAFRRFKKVTG